MRFLQGMKLSNRQEKKIVVGLGEVLWDCLPGGRVAGGAPANFACHAGALGAAAAIGSAVGRDADGEALLNAYRDKGVSVESVAVLGDLATSRVQVDLDDKGSPSYSILEGVAWDELPWTAELAELATRADAVCFGTLAQRSQVSRETIYRFLGHTGSRCLKIFDVNLRQHYYDETCIRESLKYADVLKLNEDELPIVAKAASLDATSGTLLEDLRRAFRLRVLIYTQGARGSSLVTTSMVSEQRATVVKCVDSVGAGDSFTAACVMGLLMDMPLDHLHQLATEVAAFVCGKNGATPPLPQSFRDAFAGVEIR